MEEKDHQLESFWTRHSGWVAVAFAVVVSVLGYVLDMVLVLQGVSRGLMLIFTNAVTGIVAGGLFYQLARRAKVQREAMHARVSTIAEMNHHIRNAMQVIRGLSAFPPDPSHQDEQIQLINESVERVEWALREVLPKYPAEKIPLPPPIGHKHFMVFGHSTTKAIKKAKT